MNSFKLFLSGKLFICPLILNDSFAGQSNLGCISLLFMTLYISCQFLLACKAFFKISADRLMVTPLQVTNCFSLVAFKILSLIWHFNYDVSWSGPLCIHPVWDFLWFLNLHVYFLHQIRESLFHYVFKQISNFLLFLFSFWHPIT